MKWSISMHRKLWIKGDGEHVCSYLCWKHVGSFTLFCECMLNLYWHMVSVKIEKGCSGVLSRNLCPAPKKELINESVKEVVITCSHLSLFSLDDKHILSHISLLLPKSYKILFLHAKSFAISHQGEMLHRYLIYSWNIGRKISLDISEHERHRLGDSAIIKGVLLNYCIFLLFWWKS